MSKRTKFASLGVRSGPGEGDGEEQGPPTSALLHTVAANPDNPRDDHDPELPELVDSYREVGQLQPIGVLSRELYLKHFPHNREVVGEVDWIVINGNRRLAAAKALRWARIDIVVRDHLGEGDDGGSIDEAVMIENIHRKNLAPIREAEFLQRMVERHGSQGKVAKRIGKTQAYVSQRLALLNLDPELQQAVDSRQLKVKDARSIASIDDPAEQRAKWEELKTRPTHNPVMGEGAREAGGEGASGPATGVSVPSARASTGESAEGPEEAVAEPERGESQQGETAASHNPVMTPRPRLEPIRWDDPQSVHGHARQHMTPHGQRELAKLLLDSLDNPEE